MFESLKTKNFRRLRDNTFEFTHGLNAIRGLNEHGKSTVFEALGYAMFGTEALRESLDDVVTWGEKVGTLSVELGWKVNRQNIVIRRSKAGAELDVDGKLEVTGQREVTRFCENLVADAKLASRLMMASQAGLRGALAEGPTAAAQMIEQLADFELIDQIITLVTENLPSGNPAALEAQVKQLDLQAAVAPAEPDLSSLKTRLTAAGTALARVGGELAQARKDLEPAAKAAEAMRGDMAEHQRNVQALEASNVQMKLTLAARALLNPKCSVTPEALADLRKKVADQKIEAEARVAWTELQALPKSEDEWEGDRVSFDAEMERVRLEGVKLQSRASDLGVQKARAEAGLILEQTCGLCGKDLGSVPEVVAKNLAAERLLGQLNDQLKVVGDEICVNLDMAAALRTISQVSGKVHVALQKHARFVRVLDTHVPARHVWTGPVFHSSDQPNYKDELLRAEGEVTRAADHTSRHAVLTEREAELLAAGREHEKAVKDMAVRVKSNKSVLNLETDLLAAVRQHEMSLVQVQGEKALAASQIDSEAALYQQALKAHEGLTAQRAFAAKQLEELALNNVLIKKLRAARPKVADKLWGTVLSAVSHYFSQIRGVKSSVTKDSDGFKIDGKSVKGFSGSTLDALGLALRVALTKTFMPNTDFLILDEPGAACDDEREANMLGLVAACGFSQVLLVTHSQLADVFADNVLSL